MDKVLNVQFSSGAYSDSDDFKLTDSQNSGTVRSMFWRIDTPGFLEFSAKLSSDEMQTSFVRFCLNASIMHRYDDELCHNHITVDVNGYKIVSEGTAYMIDGESFRDFLFMLPGGVLKSGVNTIRFSYESYDGTGLFVKKAWLEIFSALDNSKWMLAINNFTLLSGISMPGTHDSAAFRKWYKSPYTCHDTSITEQLQGGIRVLDIRLKTKRSQVVTCHGDVGPNEFQPFNDVLDECHRFLTTNPSEAIVMILKVDDWADYRNDPSGGKKLIKNGLENFRSILYRGKSMPTMNEVRGKIVLLNRIDDSLDFGAPASIPHNVAGTYLADSVNRQYRVYVQDKCELYSQDYTRSAAKTYKFNCFMDALRKRGNEGQWGEVYLNFASACFFKRFTVGRKQVDIPMFGIYIMDSFLNEIGKGSNLPRALGWLMFDYPFEKYYTTECGYVNVVDIVIGANTFSKGYGKRFRITDDREL